MLSLLLGQTPLRITLRIVCWQNQCKQMKGCCRNLQGYALQGPLAKGLNGLVSLVNL